METNRNRTDPYKNFRFPLLLGAAIAGLAGYLAKRALTKSTSPELPPDSRSLLVRVDQGQPPGWEDVHLAPDAIRKLREFADGARRRPRVAVRNTRDAEVQGGGAVPALFSGPSGTGKTMAGQVIANELEVDLYRVDLSRVVSRYIGETEKNLRRVFDAAEGSGAVLMLDEADALFGKRTEVKDSNDRFANIEVSYFLERVEKHDGPVILATSNKQNIDAAFRRRLRHVVDFPSPGTAEPRHKPKRGRKTPLRKAET